MRLSKRKTRMEKVVYFECMVKGCDHKTEKLAIECSRRAIRSRSTKDMRLRDIDISIRITLKTCTESAFVHSVIDTCMPI